MEPPPFLQRLPEAKSVRLVEALNRDSVGESWGCGGRNTGFTCPNNISREDLEVQEEAVLQENTGAITT